MDANSIIIREANLADLPTLLDFEQAIIQAERPLAADLKDDPINYYDLSALIESESAQVLVAEVDGTLVGSGYARIEISKPYLVSEQHAYLGFMYVAPECRGLKVNKRVIDAHIAWANERGVHHFKLEVYAANEAAIAAYLKSGFKANLVEMVMSN